MCGRITKACVQKETLTADARDWVAVDEELEAREVGLAASQLELLEGSQVDAFTDHKGF
jgi:hypothetical protein